MDGRKLGASNTSKEIQGGLTMATVSVRYIVDDVEAAIDHVMILLGVSHFILSQRITRPGSFSAAP
jgi:hypothetical protein